ncbi:helix-turn-helix domain-containing protein [Amycolatopsis carbonis]|uniref:Helix-turn-helix domain-containing protein n=1 Tax=Amycolatopsis carbonis TaxID=715471 RepID=A0A9Y2MSK9_9PSEU|nr:helix-turn-helix domain-containing protein [Amycolatopsis sp. 2-15]WIX75998.1 helix-turn-helix domain-containing protein [Amycolatopsis sp. 2-15]
MSARTTTNGDPDVLLTPTDVAKLYGVSRQTVETWIANNVIPYVPVPSGRKKIRRGDLPLTPRYADGRTAN